MYFFLDIRQYLARLSGIRPEILCPSLVSSCLFLMIINVLKAKSLLCSNHNARICNSDLQAAMWTLDDMEDDTVELIDENTLLEEADLVKPDPASLR